MRFIVPRAGFRLLPFMVVLGSVTGLAGRHHSSITPSTTDCRSPDGLTEYVRENIVEWVTDTGTIGVRARASSGFLTTVQDSVYYATDATLCHRAAVAFELLKAAPDTMNPEQVILIKAGAQRYGVTVIENDVPVVFATDTGFTRVGLGIKI